MTSLVPRSSYTDDELRRLYPARLELQLVQVLMRHGERTPVSARFQNAGLSPWWPYCSDARQLRSAVLAAGRHSFDALEWRRHLETFGDKDEPVLARGPALQADTVCDMGSLTDQGRRSTYDLGLRLRHLYVDRLAFLPPSIASTDALYLRATPVPRALESLHQAFSALYPPSARDPGPDGRFPTPAIVTRVPGDETLYPNDGNCRRFAALSRAFAERAADRWNGTPDMEYLQKIYGKWMPKDTKVAVDSRPRLSGIADTVNATLAHGPETRLPREFYDARGREIMEKIAVEEWFAGFNESKEYRMLGMGALLADVVGRMVGSVEQPPTRDGAGVRFGLSGCHDTTLAGVLASLGAYNTDRWPPFTSHLAIELFKESKAPTAAPPKTSSSGSGSSSWWPSIFGGAKAQPAGIGRRPTADLTPAEKSKMDGYYVRIRYNDEPVTVPACKLPGNHLEGDESFCTLVSGAPTRLADHESG